MTTEYIDEAVEMLEGEEVYRHRKPKPDVERAGHVKIPHAFTFYGGVSDTAKVVYMAYRSFADLDINGETYVGIARIAKELNMSTATLKRARSELVSKGFIAVEHRGFGKTRMVIVEDINEHPEIKAVAVRMLADRIRLKNDPNAVNNSIGIKNEPSLGSNMIPRLGSNVSRHNKNKSNKEQGEQEEEKNYPVSQTQPGMVQDELALLSGNAPTVSPRTEKKERKPRKPTKPLQGAVMSSDDVAPVPGSSHKEMFTALATLCKVDPKLKRGQLNATAKDLRDAGYTPADLDKFANWWYSQDFRGKQGQPPAIGLVPSLILQAVQWVPQPAWTPALAKKNGPSPETLRSWHRQYCYEQWNDHVAAELGIVNPAMPGTFKKWYDSEAAIPDDQLADWYEQSLIKSKESHQW